MLTKNQSDSSFTKQDIDEYLELYTNFKLKVQEARQEGYDTIPALIREFEGYKSQLLRPYSNLSGIDDSLVYEAYQRTLVEVRASHILISTNGRTESEALRKALEIRDLVKKGLDFDSLAVKYSEDPSATLNKGDLGYFSAFRMVLPFELAAYNTTVGNVSNPVKTQFGFHLIKVTERRPAREQLKLAHILIRNENTEKARKKITDIYSQLQQGEDWDRLCAQYSEDYNSKSKGGVLPWISSGQTAPEFENIAYSLDSGEVSTPTKTPYGWHLIKLIDKKGPGNFESQKALIEQKLKRNNSESLDEMELTQILKGRYNFQQRDSLVYSVLAERQVSDTAVLFQFDDQAVSVKAYENFLESSGEKKNLDSYNRFVAKLLKGHEEQRILSNYPEASFLVKEYDEGLLLFEIMDDKVWSRAVQDSAGLQRFYENSISDYEQDSSFRVVLLSPDVTDTVKSKAFVEELSNTILDVDNLQEFASENNLIFEESIVGFDDPVIASLSLKQKLNIVNTEGVFAVVILEYIGVQQLALADIRGQVISEYQNYLDAKWINELRTDAEWEVNENELANIYDKYAK